MRFSKINRRFFVPKFFEVVILEEKMLVIEEMILEVRSVVEKSLEKKGSSSSK